MAKYLKMRELAASAHIPSSRLSVGEMPVATIEPAEPWMEDGQGGAHEDSFWLVGLWGTVLCSLFVGCIRPLILLKNHYQDIPAPSRGILSAEGGLVEASLIALLMVAALYAFRTYSTRRGLILMYALFTGGGILVFALMGGIVYFLLNMVRSLFVAVGFGGLMPVARTAGVAAALFLALNAMAIYVEPPGNPTWAKPGPDTFFGLGNSAQEMQELKARVPDPVEYKDAVESAKEHYGADFPAGGRKSQYRYYRNVYVEPAQKLKPDFDGAIRTLLYNGQLQLASNSPESVDIRLMFFNAALFRDWLQRDRIILDDLGWELRDLAGTWGHADWVTNGDPGFEERVAEFDSRGPFATTESIPKQVRRWGLPPEALSPPVRRTARPPSPNF